MRRIPTLSDVGSGRFLEDPQVGLLDLGVFLENLICLNNQSLDVIR